MRACPFFDHSPSSGRAKRFNGKVFSFVHLCFVSIGTVLLDNGHALWAVNRIRDDSVSAEIGDGFNYDERR